MTDSGDFKSLVRQRMSVTGEKYTEAHRALLEAASAEVVPDTHPILPRVAARFMNGQPRPISVSIRMPRRLVLELEVPDLEQYVAANEDGRDELVREWIVDQIEDLIDEYDLFRDHALIREDQFADERIRDEATHVGVTPDQYAWLEETLTREEFESIPEEAMRRLLADNYSEFLPERSR